MPFKPRSKSIIIIIIIGSFLLGFLFCNYSKIIFQEGNPWPEIKSIFQLTFSKSDIVKLSNSDNSYLTKSPNGAMIIDAFMEDKGYKFIDQMGSGYFYESSNEDVVITRRQYSRFYAIWTISYNNKEEDNGLWTIITDNNISFKYPKELLTKYISLVNWPPQVKTTNNEFICNPSGDEVRAGGRTELRLVDNNKYCLTKESEGAAGSTYTTYTYTFPKDNQIIIINFVLRFVQCKNYDDPQMSECEKENSSFDIDSIINRIAQSIIIKTN